MKHAHWPRPPAILLAVAAVFMQSPALAAPATPADAIYAGGTIVTVNEFQPQVQAIAVRGGRIVAAGYSDEVMKLKGAKTRMVDLGGNTLVPGFVDPHGHVFNRACRRSRPTCCRGPTAR
jgi:predicted amidohydrolase YtcJ